MPETYGYVSASRPKASELSVLTEAPRSSSARKH